MQVFILIERRSKSTVVGVINRLIFRCCRCINLHARRSLLSEDSSTRFVLVTWIYSFFTENFIRHNKKLFIATDFGAPKNLWRVIQGLINVATSSAIGYYSGVIYHLSAAAWNYSGRLTIPISEFLYPLRVTSICCRNAQDFISFLGCSPPTICLHVK